jgi:hypothetical protein
MDYLLVLIKKWIAIVGLYLAGCSTPEIAEQIKYCSYFCQPYGVKSYTLKDQLTYCECQDGPKVNINNSNLFEN